ncbi:MAG: hypothetical protein ABFD59_08255 [Smithella sp.]
MGYFPNGTAGMYLEEQCASCIMNDGPDSRDPVVCPVWAASLNYNSEQLKPGNEKLREAMNMLIDEHGNCLMKQQIENSGKLNREYGSFTRSRYDNEKLL